MSEEGTTTMRVKWSTKKQLRGYAKHPRETDEEVLKRVLEQLEEAC